MDPLGVKLCGRCAALELALRITARLLRAPDGLPCYCDDLVARERAGSGHSVKCVAARAALEDEEDAALYARDRRLSR